jgi:hypothetical protein
LSPKPAIARRARPGRKRLWWRARTTGRRGRPLREHGERDTGRDFLREPCVEGGFGVGRVGGRGGEGDHFDSKTDRRDRFTRRT